MGGELHPADARRGRAPDGADRAQDPLRRQAPVLRDPGLRRPRRRSTSTRAGATTSASTRSTSSGICFDSYNDKRTGFEFDLTASGGKIDLVLGNGELEWDTTWDAVWDGKVAHDEKGWTAEFRIPLNQLRFGKQKEQVWGMHAWRWLTRNKEESQWQLIPAQNTGRMYQLGELHGIRDAAAVAARRAAAARGGQGELRPVGSRRGHGRLGNDRPRREGGPDDRTSRSTRPSTPTSARSRPTRRR